MRQGWISVERMTARVFCHSTIPGGGNPVTVFLPQRPLQEATEISLARQCEWESVFLHQKEMSFYMPSGNQVRFCAHAALGGAVAATSDRVLFISKMIMLFLLGNYTSSIFQISIAVPCWV